MHLTEVKSHCKYGGDAADTYLSLRDKARVFIISDIDRPSILQAPAAAAATAAELHSARQPSL